MSNPVTNNPQLEETLKILDKFGFRFFGYSETKDPLVIAPNGQIVSVSIAYKFVQDQVAKASSSTADTNNVENMPQAPQNILNMPTQIDSKVETAPERSPEQQKQNNEVAQNIASATKVATSAPQMSVPVSQSPVFGDGFQPTSFNPRDIAQAIQYIETNSRANATSSRRWLSVQLEKFLAELEGGSQKAA